MGKSKSYIAPSIFYKPEDKGRWKSNHPFFEAFSWLLEKSRDYRVSGGNWLDVVIGSGRTLLTLLGEHKFKGTVYTVHKERGVLEDLEKSLGWYKLKKDIDLIPINVSPSEIADDMRIPLVQCVSAIESCHEAYSIYSLLAESDDIGLQKYNEVIDGLVKKLGSGSYFFFQDLHGAKDNQYTAFEYVGYRGEVAKHMLRWVMDPSYHIPENYLDPLRTQIDNKYWTPVRRELLTKKALQGQELSPQYNFLTFNILTEVAYRIGTRYQNRLRIYFADRCHKIHCALTGNQFLKDIKSRGVRLLQSYSVNNEQARKFFLNAGIKIKSTTVPAIYTAAVFKKK